ncbi:LpqB family beta-propeller domain-containing protein [Nocardioides sp.]|uniref:LpqB family beta-propeller domain-containing protein n=1 Tax=Nocardioides sp. TaxID=35761 RepID=UPI003D13FCB9
MRRAWIAAAGTCLALALAGCVQIPDSGPVQSVDTVTGATGDQGQRFEPRGPQPGESSQDLVRHFFEAMTASPMSVTVARQFLTKSASSDWSPERGFLVYAGKVSPTGTRTVDVDLTGVSRFDARGAWQGPAPGGRQRLRFTVEMENGQRRISSLPDLLMVSEPWFETQTVPLSLFFFDPETRTLVPEPVFVPRGDQQPTLLIRGLLEGPMDSRVEQTFVPAGTTLSGLSVTVRPDGVAEIPLSGDLANAPAQSVELMAAQFAWTLRQVPGVTAVRITVDGQTLPLSGGSTEFSVSRASNYNAAGIHALGELYGLHDGLAVRVLDGEEEPLLGSFGKRDYGLRDIAVNLDASRVAGVTQDGTRVLIAGMSESEDRKPQVVLRGARDLLAPSWDAGERLWVVDRNAGRAVVSVITQDDEGRASAQVVPIGGVSGRAVIDVAVSRDGTRLVAALRGPRGDRIVVSRLFIAGPDATVRATSARAIVTGDDERLQIRDVGWRSPTSLFYLNVLGGRQTNLRSALVDGSPTVFDPVAYSGVFPDLGTRVVSSPRPEEPVYLQRAGGGYQPVGEGSPPIPEGITALTYVG